MTQTAKLAIRGGKPAVAKSVTFKVWPRLTKDDEKFVLASLRQPWHAWGPNCTALQTEFAQWNGNKFALATNSGTAALHMALAAGGIGCGDEVITTTVSWTSSATCILHHNAIPIFVDVDWDTQLIDPTKIEAAITRKTKAILPVHYWGVPCDMDAILAIAKKHKLYVIEDACQAHGATYRGRKVGTLGDCGAFSLNQNKNWNGGEGGLFVTDDEPQMVKARALMSFGEMNAPEAKRDFHSYGMGWMYRTSDVAAAYARAGLKNLDRTNTLARANYDYLQEKLAGLPGFVAPKEAKHSKGNGYAYVLRVDPGLVKRREDLAPYRDAVIQALTAEGVPVASARWMLPAHTVFQAKNGYGHGCPWACPHARQGIDYALKQYPVSLKVIDSCIQIAINGHRPPNGRKELDAIVRGVRKVFEHLDQVSMPEGR
jgi:dTDP-4-amino-4,6-dideoxygalactose transaminase